VIEVCDFTCLRGVRMVTEMGDVQMLGGCSDDHDYPAVPGLPGGPKGKRRVVSLPVIF
jgi:hypothetical protein